MDEIRVPIYFMAGFLESGKSTFLDFTIAQDYFQIEGNTLLILCEEGEVEFDEKMLKKSRTSVEVLNSLDELTPERLVAYDAFYSPERVIIEYNGMWQVSKFEEMQLPKDWGIVQHIVTVDASTFQVYMNNMKSLFVEMVRNADMVLFNRCSMDMPLASFRRSVLIIHLCHNFYPLTCTQIFRLRTFTDISDKAGVICTAGHCHSSRNKNIFRKFSGF